MAIFFVTLSTKKTLKTYIHTILLIIVLTVYIFNISVSICNEEAILRNLFHNGDIHIKRKSKTENYFSFIFSCRRSRADLVVSIGVLVVDVVDVVVVLEPLLLLSE